jgi:hypothetical protein
VAKGAVTGSTELQQTLSFLDACIDEAGKKTLTNLVGTLSNDAVVSLWSAYANPNLFRAFQGSVRAEAQHFADVLANRPSERGKVIFYQPINAYGRLRWAKLKYNTTDAHNYFLTWVPPDLEPIVAAANSGATPLDPSTIANHLPDPVVEQARVVRIDAWGALRLANVVGQEGVMHFQGWIPKARYAEVEAQAEHQIGGLETVRPDLVQDKVAPGPAE